MSGLVLANSFFNAFLAELLFCADSLYFVQSLHCYSLKSRVGFSGYLQSCQ